jgi:hypothetical protein
VEKFRIRERKLCFLLPWSFCWSGHGNGVLKILRTLSLYQIYPKTAVFLGPWDSYQLKHTFSRTEDAKKCVYCSMQTEPVLSLDSFCLLPEEQQTIEFLSSVATALTNCAVCPFIHRGGKIAWNNSSPLC